MEKYIEYDKQFEKDDVTDKVLSVQSIFADTLKDIHRPDIPWEKHKDYIKRLVHMTGKEPIKVEIISDLPHMDTLRHVTQLVEFSKVGVQRIQYHQFALLPNAPAYSKEWQEKWGLHEIKVYNVHFNVESLDDEHVRNMTTEHLTFLYKGSMQMKIFNTILYEYFNSKNVYLSKLEKNLDKLYALSIRVEKQMEQYREKTGILVWGDYLSHQKRWVSYRVAMIELIGLLENSKLQRQFKWKDKDEILELLSPKNLAA
jgi:wyosine [tRNA(Phe)-imidazoG37] synthetase (radical SAM superfamily)